MLTIEEIRDAVTGKGPLVPLCIPVPKWGGDIFVMRMNADQLDGLQMAWGRHIEETKGVGYRAFVVAWCLCDENNQPLARDRDDGENEHTKLWDTLRGESASLIDGVYERAAKINGIMPGDDEAATEAAAKN